MEIGLAFQSGSGDRIAIEVMYLDGAERHQVTTGLGTNFSQRWSPDSSRLAYVVENGAGMIDYVVNVDGSEQMLLTTIAGDDVGDWSPDGKSVIFAVHEGDGQGIYIRNPDGVNEFRLTQEPDFSPVWSPDSPEDRLPVTQGRKPRDIRDERGRF